MNQSLITQAYCIFHFITKLSKTYKSLIHPVLHNTGVLTLQKSRTYFSQNMLYAEREVSSIKSLQQRGKPTERVIPARRCCYLGLHSKLYFPSSPLPKHVENGILMNPGSFYESGGLQKFQRSLPPLANISRIVRETCGCCVQKTGLKRYNNFILSSFL